MNRKDVVIVGHGMVAHHLVANLGERGTQQRLRLSVLGEEPRAAYDRVHLSHFFEGKTAGELSLVEPGSYEQLGVELSLGDSVVSIDRECKHVQTASGRRVAYGALVLATGSRPFVPPVPGADTRGAFVYRTIEDLERIRAWAERSRVGVVIGGGLLGLEAANALKAMGLETHVVELAPRLMALQIDDAGGLILRSRIEELGVTVHTAKSTSAVESEDGVVSGLLFADGSKLPCDLLVFSAGIRPRDELARAAGLATGERGGIAIDSSCTTSDPAIFAIGECAAYRGRCYGLVAPGYRMAECVAARLAGDDANIDEFDMNTKLKLLGVDVASFGDAFGAEPGSRQISFFDSVAQVYKKIVVSADGKRLLGGMLVGDASDYAELVAYVQGGIALPDRPEELISPRSSGAERPRLGVDGLPESAMICSCHNVPKGTICSVIRDQKLTEVGRVKTCTKAGTGCGSCTTLITDLLKLELKRAGVAVTNHLCEHFPYSRQELFHLVRVNRARTFEELIARHGRGRGCEICKPAVASILASTYNDYILEPEHVSLQDTNDRFLANIQRDGTYSVVPRVPGGEITPRQLIALGQVAERYGLYSKITGAQRVDLFGARVEQLPDIWRELIAAGFESGHAYGKALRTVKSCVGSTWCRYGVQDSVGLAIRVENRYKGLRAPHKLKGAVSGCARECAEAQGKDFGVIATEKGYNLYVCGNGGMKPQHAQLFAVDLDEQTLIRYLDRFLMFYVRTADRLQRTAAWFNNLEGGLDYLRRVIIDDSLGICAELEADMGHIVGTYECEWRATLQNPKRLKLFRAFVNTDARDPSIVFVKEREQQRPAFPAEKTSSN
jgi:nitrite reductase (NADH) large subunit